MQQTRLHVGRHRLLQTGVQDPHDFDPTKQLLN